MKKYLITLTVTAVLLIPVSSMLASPPVGESGSVDLDQRRGVITIFSHDENAGGGTWYHGFEGLNKHWSDYDHRSKDHKSSVSNSKATEHGPWNTKDEGFSYSWIFSTLTGNKANWNTR